MGLFSGIALVCVEFLEWVLMGFCYGWFLMVWVCRGFGSGFAVEGCGDRGLLFFFFLVVLMVGEGGVL